MSLRERVEADMKQAMRDQNVIARDTLRMTLSSLKNRRIELGRDLEEAEEQAVISKAVRSRQESAEQFTSAKEVDGRADLWSLAVVAYHALTGQPSFRGETLGQVMMAVMTRQYEPPHVYRPDLPAPLAQWFDRAFGQEIDGRFQTADEFSSTFIKALERASNSGLLITAPESPPALGPGPSPVAGIQPTVLGAPAPQQPGLTTNPGAMGVGTNPGAVGTLDPATATYDPSLTQGGQSSKAPVIVLSIVGVLVVAGGIGAAVMLTGGSGDETASAADGETAAATAEPSDDPTPADTGSTATAEPTATAEATGDTSTAEAAPTAEPTAAVAAKRPPGRLPTRPRPQPKPNPAPTATGEKDHGY